MSKSKRARIAKKQRDKRRRKWSANAPDAIRVPSVREFANQTGLSVDQANLALQDMRQLGYADDQGFTALFARHMLGTIAGVPLDVADDLPFDELERRALDVADQMEAECPACRRHEDHAHASAEGADAAE